MEKSIGKYFDKHHSLIVLLLILFGTAIRILGISILPEGLNQDEASIGYEAFSLLHDGIDRNGVKYPVHLISWGNGQNALYAYLTMPVVKIFGLNPFSVRLLNALFGSLSLLIVYLFFKSAFDRKKALTALAFLTICPWSVMIARWGLESNIFPVIFLIAVFFLFKGITKNQIYYSLSAVFFAISLYSYGPSYLVVPLFFLLILVYLIFLKKISWKSGLLPIILFLVLAFPMILFVIVNNFDLETIRIGEISIPKMVDNRTGSVFNIFSGNFFLTLIKNSVRFFSILFLQTDNLLFNAIPSFGIIYHISLPFFFFGVYRVLKNKSAALEPHNFIMLAWLACSVILGITVHANINRVNSIMFPIIYFTILGFYSAKEILAERHRNKLKHSLILFYTVSFLFFTVYYVSFFNEKNRDGFSYGLGEAIQYANKKFPEGNINVTTHSINMPYIYVCFFSETNPAVFRETVKYDQEDLNGGFRRVLSFDRYSFRTDALAANDAAIISKDEFLFSNLIENREYESFGNYYVVFPK